MLSGNLSQLVSYTGFAIVLFSGDRGQLACSCCVAGIRMLERPFRAWGYPWAPGLFIVASAAMVANELWRNPRTSSPGLALIAAGIPVYLDEQAVAASSTGAPYCSPYI